MSGEKVCDCDYWHSKHRWHCSTNYPTPVPSEVAETTAGEREVEALAADMWNDFEGSPFIDITRRDAESIARSVLASPALAALLDRVRREEGAKAWDEGWEAAWSPMSMSNRNDGPNPYRAASVGRGEGQ